MSALAVLGKADVVRNTASTGKLEIKAQIQETLADVENTHYESLSRVKDLESLVVAWQENLILVRKKIENAKVNNPEAVYSLEVLEDQAKRYNLGYEKQLEEEKAYDAEIEKSIPKLTATLRQLEAIDKVTLLDAKLQKLAAGTDIADDRLAVTNTRDIQVLLHTAQALVELKKGK